MIGIKFMNKSKIKIGIVGYGYVGKAFHNFFKSHYECLIYDPNLNTSVTKDEINKTYDQYTNQNYYFHNLLVSFYFEST